MFLKHISFLFLTLLYLKRTELSAMDFKAKLPIPADNNLHLWHKNVLFFLIHQLNITLVNVYVDLVVFTRIAGTS